MTSASQKGPGNADALGKMHIYMKSLSLWPWCSWQYPRHVISKCNQVMHEFNHARQGIGMIDFLTKSTQGSSMFHFLFRAIHRWHTESPGFHMTSVYNPISAVVSSLEATGPLEVTSPSKFQVLTACNMTRHGRLHCTALVKAGHTKGMYICIHVCMCIYIYVERVSVKISYTHIYIYVETHICICIGVYM